MLSRLKALIRWMYWRSFAFKDDSLFERAIEEAWMQGIHAPDEVLVYLRRAASKDKKELS